MTYVLSIPYVPVTKFYQFGRAWCTFVILRTKNTAKRYNLTVKDWHCIDVHCDSRCLMTFTVALTFKDGWFIAALSHNCPVCEPNSSLDILTTVTSVQY